MSYTTFIHAEELGANLDTPNWAVLDCRFALADTELGRRAYQQAHIPGALYAHLDEDLSSLVIPGKTSRHPLPAIEDFIETLSNWGINEDTQVVVYDDAGGGIAARLWWMLRWVGHEAVAVLNGGLSHWQTQGRATKAGTEARPAGTFIQRPSLMQIVGAERVMAIRNSSDHVLVDSRSPERYRGEEEKLDPVAGRIPGAINAFYQDNLNADGLVESKEALKARFTELLGDTPAENTVFYCGSGVTASFNILAVMHAGLGSAALYPGSWSEWITDPNRPVATGES